ncbi:MAG: hypothetical protein R3B68_11970 [Phycisphaerales bacterium]
MTIDDATTPIDESLAPVDLLAGPLERRLQTLAAVGLGDARVFIRPASTLSVGEHARLRIAIALDTLHRQCAHRTADAPPATLILDEFAAPLDRPIAALLARLLARLIRRPARRLARRPHPPLRLICITAHDDLLEPLAPDIHINIDPNARSSRPRAEPDAQASRSLNPPNPTRVPTPLAVQPDARASGSAHKRPTPAFTIEPATRHDYLALAHHHYRPAHPAVLAGPGAIRRAVSPDGQLLGVIVIAMPTMNAAWRDAIWPGRYRTHDKHADAARLASELRCIARVIIAPRHRGLGIAAALVRHYLATPLTPATEAVAAMGLASPFFAAAGMTPYRLPPTRRDARLADALAHLRIRPDSLLDLGFVASMPALLERELRHWATASRATRSLSNDPPAIARRAAGALLAPPIAYAHVRPCAANTIGTTHAHTTLALPTEPHLARAA